MRIKKKNNSIKAVLEQFLKDNHCTYKVSKDDNGTTTFGFEFQAGNFLATVRSQDDCVEVTYPVIATAPMTQLALVRAKCNDRNNGNILFKFTYTIDQEAGEVQVHMSFFNNQFDAENFIHELKAAFHFQREWQRDFDEAVSISKDYDSADLESEVYKHHREMYLLRNQEIRHQMGPEIANIAAGTGRLSLLQLLETVSPLPDSQLLFMTVNTVNSQQRIEEEDAILGFDLRRALVEGTGKQARLTRDYAVLDLHYKQGRD